MTAPLLNSLYRPRRQGASSGRGPSVRTVDVLRPCCELQGLEIWQGVFMRDNLLLHHRCVHRKIGVCDVRVCVCVLRCVEVPTLW